MSVEGWKLVYWMIATIGVAGTIALIVFAPTVAKIALDAVVRLFAFVLSYRVGCALVAAVLAAFIADYARHSSDDAKHAAEIAEFEKAQNDRDKRIAKKTRDEVWAEIANATAENAVIDTKVKEFHDALPPIPAMGNPFAVGDASCRLREIAGLTGCGPQGTKRVSKARPQSAGARAKHWTEHRLPGLITRGFGRVE